MSRETILDEKAKSLDELLNLSINDIFSPKDKIYDHDSDEFIRDSEYAFYILEQYKHYQRNLKKQVKTHKHNHQQSLEALINILGQEEVNKIKSLQNLSNLDLEQYVLCDLSPLLCMLALELDNPKALKKQNLSTLNQIMSDEVCCDFALEISPFHTLIAAALNRSIIKCKAQKISDDILLNSSDIFTKMPQYGLTLDLENCLAKDIEGSSITGIIVSTLNFNKMHPKQNALEKISHDQKAYIKYFTCSLASDNQELSPLDFVFKINAERSVGSVLQETLLQLNEDEIDKLEKQNGALFSYVENKNALPQDIYDNIKEAFKYVVYSIVHQDKLKAQLDNSSFNNIAFDSQISLKKLAQDAPFKHFILED